MNWKKILRTTCSIAIGAYLVFAFFAFSKPDETAVCTKLSVDIEVTNMQGFLTPEEVSAMLSNEHLHPQGHAIATLDLRKIEETLERKELIDKAECYATQDGVVMVKVRQRIPVVRVINDRGEDYYVDSNGKPMPHGNYVCDLIVTTGHVSALYAEKYLTPLVNQVMSDPFWKNQVVQFNILSDGSVEMIPRVGGHVVYLGQPFGIRKKLERLRKFYLYGLNVAGWNKYSRISVEFDNQIICKRRGKSNRG